MSRLFKRTQAYFDRERFYESPYTITFYKNNERVARVRDVNHLLPFDNNLYISGIEARKFDGKFIISRDEFDYAVYELDFDKNFQFCRNLIRDLKNGRSGRPLSRRIELTFETYKIDYLPMRFEVWVLYILRHYGYRQYKLIKILDLNKNSKNYLSVEYKLKERSLE